MKTIGTLLRERREKLYLTLNSLEKSTKIKSSFIDSIENGQWEDLPPFPTVLGFVKSLAGDLRIDEKLAVATLKRDYPPQKTAITPKPDVKSKTAWGPKMTFILGIATVSLIFFGYLIVQYVKFISPPSLIVESPRQDQVIEQKSVIVFGKTDNDVQLIINNQPVLVDDSGKFSVDLQVSENTKEIVVTATSRSGKQTTIHRKIEVK